MTKRRLKTLAVVIALGFLGLGISLYLSLRDVPSVTIAKTHFPLVRYQGFKVPPSVEWSRGRPDSWVSLTVLPKHLLGAVIVSEDWAFFQHGGMDWKQIREAVWVDLKARRFVRGASTITQQVARNLFLEKDKTLWRKLKELVLALSLERNLSKKRIFELYLNIAEWGRGLYGIGPASRYYFKKSPAGLTPKEGAFLAMLLPSPRRYSLSYYKGKLTPHAEEKVQDILDKMVQAGFLSREEAAVAAHFPLPFEETIELITPDEEAESEPPPGEDL